MPNYGDAKYWDERYRTQKNTTFDWLEGWDDLKEIIEKHCVNGLYVPQQQTEGQAKQQQEQQQTKQSKSNFLSMHHGNQPMPNMVAVPEEQQTAIKSKLEVLNLGCGNSIICEEMYDEGYLNVWNMDISAICIQQMLDRNQKTRPEMKWDVMDVRELKYEDGFFDLIVDKSTIDALLCGDQAYLNVAIMLRECQRVLKEGGYYVAISYGQPENRIFHFKRAFLHVNLMTYQIQKVHYGTEPKTYHYVYVLRKLPNADAVCQKNWEKTYNQIKKEIDDEQSDGGYSQSKSVGARSEKPKSEVAKNEVSVTNEEQQSQQSFNNKNTAAAGGQTAAEVEVDEKTFEAQQDQDGLEQEKQISDSLPPQSEQQSKDFQ